MYHLAICINVVNFHCKVCCFNWNNLVLVRLSSVWSTKTVTGVCGLSEVCISPSVWLREMEFIQGCDKMVIVTAAYLVSVTHNKSWTVGYFPTVNTSIRKNIFAKNFPIPFCDQSGRIQAQRSISKVRTSCLIALTILAFNVLKVSQDHCPT